MTYVVNISGGKDGLSSEDAAAFEYGVARLAHELVQKLDGVVLASFGGAHYAHADLRQEPQPPAGTPAVPTNDTTAL